MKNEKGQGVVEYALIMVLVAVVVMAIGTLIVPSFNDDSNQSNDVTITEVLDYEFTYIVVDGMPCIVYDESPTNHTQYGIACNWNTWDGVVVNGEIEIRE